MEKSNRILQTVKEMFPNASCELNYNNHYELLIAVVLSAQTTDKRVNEVTVELFKKYQAGDMFAKDDLVNGNLKLVLSILKKYKC